MRKSALTFALCISCVSVAYLAGCSNPADDKPAASVTAAKDLSGTGLSADDPAKVFVLASDSKIEFTGSKVTGSHEGGFRSFEGEIHLSGNDPTTSRVQLTIDTTSLWADNARLTGHLKSPDFFDVEKFPKSTFDSASIQREQEGYSITGNLSLHGITKSITFPAEIEVGENTVKARAEFYIKRFDFGIVYAGKADNLIRDEVVIRLDMTGTPKESA